MSLLCPFLPSYILGKPEPDIKWQWRGGINSFSWSSSKTSFQTDSLRQVESHFIVENNSKSGIEAISIQFHCYFILCVKVDCVIQPKEIPFNAYILVYSEIYFGIYRCPKTRSERTIHRLQALCSRFWRNSGTFTALWGDEFWAGSIWQEGATGLLEENEDEACCSDLRDHQPWV